MEINPNKELLITVISDMVSEIQKYLSILRMSVVIKYEAYRMSKK